MNSATPVWVTILVAVIAPVLTLVGVLWTQSKADRRADEDAKLRLENDLKIHKYEQRRTAYEQILIAVRPILAKHEVEGETVTAFLTATEPFHLYCSQNVDAALDDFAEALGNAGEYLDGDEMFAVWDEIAAKGMTLRKVMREELSSASAASV